MNTESCAAVLEVRSPRAVSVTVLATRPSAQPLTLKRSPVPHLPSPRRPIVHKACKRSNNPGTRVPTSGNLQGLKVVLSVR